MAIEIDPTCVSHAFNAGNYSAVYVSTDLNTAWKAYAGEDHFAGDAYRPAFVLGFFSSCEEDERDDEAYTDAWNAPVGQACYAAGYCD